MASMREPNLLCPDCGQAYYSAAASLLVGRADELLDDAVPTCERCKTPLVLARQVTPCSRSHA